MNLSDSSKSSINNDSHVPHDHWQDESIPDPLTAAYHIGRLMNQLTWHLQQDLIFVRSADRENMIDLILGQINAGTFQLTVGLPNLFSPIVEDVSEQWKRCQNSEAIAEEVHSVLHDTELEHEDESLQDSFQGLITNCITSILEPLHRRISCNLFEDECWALELGRCLDEGVRRPDVSRFIFDGIECKEVPCRPTDRYPYDFEVHSLPRWTLFGPGDLEPDPAWFFKLESIAGKAGMPTAMIDSIQKFRKKLETGETAVSFSDIVSILDANIRVQLRTSDKIPTRCMSRPMTLEQAASHHAGELVKNPTMYFKRLYESGKVHRPVGTKKRLQFDIRDFPEKVRPKMLPLSEQT